MFQHDRNNSFKNRTVDLKTGVIVDLDEPRFKIPVNHKIKSKNLKIILMPFMIQNLIIGLNNIISHLLQLRHNTLFKIIIFRRVSIVKVPLKLGIR